MASGGGTTNTYTKPTQIKDYRFLLGESKDQLNAGGFYDKNYAGGMDTYAGQSDAQRQLYERIMGPQGALTRGMGALEKTLGPYDANNPALTAAIQAAAGDVNQNLQENLLPAIGDQATGAGQYGGSRQGIAQGIALRGANKQVGDMAAHIT